MNIAMLCLRISEVDGKGCLKCVFTTAINYNILFFELY